MNFVTCLNGNELIVILHRFLLWQVISKEKYLVKAFSKEFETLWDKFHPKYQKGFSEKPARETWVTADYMR